ncbi:fimbrial protein [Zestomonas carbonaria]|uniref:Type-1 fimbrial protein, A chain n=1 Tax=Zestomonas carbonaria TaxID=2762745 RepID=A0A7U7EN50_9GAMM|nr:fimbrial protein [Pseudomonas carbonaria]CAD5107941.1 Type-1 fimbrial protein, A chain [Pseudomonas carbonaria]
MQKHLLAAMVSLAGVSISLGAFAASPAAGTLNVTGKVTSTACALDPTQVDVNVALPIVDKSLLANQNDTAGRTRFVLNVTSCDPGVKASVAFTPDGNVDANGNLKNISVDPNGVTNAQVQILDENLNPINIANDTNVMNRAVVADASGNAALQYYAQYFAAQNDTTPGALSASVQFVMSYE